VKKKQKQRTSTKLLYPKDAEPNKARAKAKEGVRETKAIKGKSLLRNPTTTSKSTRPDLNSNIHEVQQLGIDTEKQQLSKHETEN
jgi:hypothetical protein